MLTLYYDPIYTHGIDPTARFPRDRYRLLAERLEHHQDITLKPPRLATREELALAHDTEYIDAFLESRLSAEAIRTIGLRPWTDSLIKRTRLITGGSLQALEQVLEHGGISGNMAGGTHHAYRSFGTGYCIFNDIAICAFAALQRPQIEKVLILDLDVHQGDGTAAICAHEPRIFTCSIHAEANFPFRKMQSDLDVHLDDAVRDCDYLNCLEHTLTKIEAHTFDLILYQAGVDPLDADALGRLQLSRECLKARNEQVFKLHRQHDIPMVVFMGGGYSNPITATVDAFEDLFTMASRYTV